MAVFFGDTAILERVLVAATYDAGN